MPSWRLARHQLQWGRNIALADPHDLYGLPLDQFVSERGALAKSLRGEGRREQAAEVAGLRKPSVAAWAVNQLVRTQCDAVAALFEAGDQLQRAESELLAGRGDAAALRKAAERERAAVDQLAQAARGLLSSQGHELAQSMLDRVSATLHAAAVDEGARALVRDGCLASEPRHVGFGASVATGAPTPAERAPARKAKADSRRVAEKAESGARRVAEKAESGARRVAEKAESDARRAAKKAESDARRAAKKAESDARRAAERAARDVQIAEDRRDRAGNSLRAAEAELSAAREHAEAAVLAHERASQALRGG